MPDRTCPACGAPLKPGDEACSLCGTAAPAALDPAPDSAPAPEAITPGRPSGTARVSRPVCAECGHANPPGARFCNRCGAPLEVRDESPEEEPVSTAAVGKQLGAMLGIGLVTLVALFAVTRLSDRSAPVRPQTAPPAATLPEEPRLDGEAAARVAALEQEIASSSDSLRIVAARQEIVELRARGEQYVAAAEAQAELAASLETASAWADAGHLYIEGLLRAEPAQRALIAAPAARAFERAVALDSTNLDVRTELAIAYQYTDAPMRAVEVLRGVLAQDSAHVAANFNFGLMQMQIGRHEQATEFLERVVRLTQPGTAVHQQATTALAQLRGETPPSEPAAPGS